MAPTKHSDDKQPKRKAVRTTIKLKKEIIAMFESGRSVSILAKEYNMPRTTIGSIIKKKEAIKTAHVAKGIKILAASRSQTVEEMENLLLLWISEKQIAGDIISKSVICEKAKKLYDDLQQKSPGTSGEFMASRGWFEKFKSRTGIHSVVRHGEASSSNTEDFRNNIKGFIPQQYINCNETSVFCKKVTKRTYVTREEKAMPVAKPMKDNLRVMVCGKTGSDWKIKPLPIHHSENTRVFQKSNVKKNNLNVMWRANNKGDWVTPQSVVNVCLGNSVHMENDSDDGEELVEEDRGELTTEELLELHKGKASEAVMEISSDDEGSSNGSIPTADIMKILTHWTKTQNMVEKWHPNVAIVNQNINAFNDNVIDHFKKVLKNRQKRGTADKFFFEQSSAESSPKRSPSPEFVLPDVLITCDSP